MLFKSRLGSFVFLPALVCAQSESVEKAAQALLDAKCAACHGATRMSGLDLRDGDAILKGGKRGPAVVPGNAEASLLYKAVRREGDLQMPARKAAAHGRRNQPSCATGSTRARELASTSKPAAATWWSFRKPVRPPVPAVKNAARCAIRSTPSFWRRLEQNGLHPRASRRSPHPGPSRVLRSPRPPADSGTGGAVCQRQIRRRL